jgi:glycerol dehydrogenase-like iron-containing ADH family enzyme
MKITYLGESRGLGDTIAKITEATGIKKVVDTIAEATGVDCGCPKRQETLNEMFPYNNKENERTETTSK